MRRQILSEADVADRLKQLAIRISGKHPEKDFVLMGIYNRGVPIAKRLGDLLDTKTGSLDISLYRDDPDNRNWLKSIQKSDIPFEIDRAKVILVDDVLFTGRTIRSAIDGLMDYGRPSRIELAVLVDRGNREMPIQADYVAEVIETQPTDYVEVRLKEVDEEEEGVYFVQSQDES